MDIIILILGIIAAFTLGVIRTRRSFRRNVEEAKCPFQNACTMYHDVETNAAVKRVLNLMLENDVSPADIKKEIEKILPS